MNTNGLKEYLANAARYLNLSGLTSKLLSATSGYAAVPRDPRFEREAHEWLQGKTCANCGGKDNLQVHHSQIPVHFPGGKEREMDKTQWMALCMAPGKLCHLLAGHSGDFKAFNPHCHEDIKRNLERFKNRVYAAKEQPDGQ